MRAIRTAIGGAVPSVQKVAPRLGIPSVLTRARAAGWILPDASEGIDQQWLETQLIAAQGLAASPHSREMDDIVRAVGRYLDARTYRNLPADLIDGVIRSVQLKFRTPEAAVQFLWEHAKTNNSAQWASTQSNLTDALAETWGGATKRYYSSLHRDPQIRRWLEPGPGTTDFGPVRVRFGVPNPRQVPAFRRTVDQMTLGLNDRTQRGVVRAIEVGLLEGRNPLDVARDIRAVSGFGLNEQQVVARNNYRRQLEAGQWGAARRRGLHDQRFTVAPETQERIDFLVNRYTERLAEFRARTIARTEMLRITNLAAQESWEDLANQGVVLREDLRRYWITAPDNASGAGAAWNAPAITGPCPVCAPIPSLNAEGRAMEEPFTYEGGEVLLPPLHPNCRCAVFYRPRFLSIPERHERAEAMGLPRQEPPVIDIPLLPSAV